MIRGSHSSERQSAIDHYNKLGLLNAAPKTGGHRTHGVLFNQSLRQRQRRSTNMDSVRQDLTLSQRAGQASAALQAQIDRVGDWLVECGWKAVDALPGWPSLPQPWLVGATTIIDEPGPQRPNEDIFVLLNCKPPPQARNPEAYDAHAYADAVASVVGEAHVHVVDGGDCEGGSLGMLARQSPTGVLMGNPVYNDREQAGIDAIADFLVQRGHEIEYLAVVNERNQGINFANVHAAPEHGLLVLADAPHLGVMNPMARPKLINAFGQPAYVLHVAIRADATVTTPPDGVSMPLCLQLNMFFHHLKNQRGESLALLHPDCAFSVQRLHPGGGGKDPSVEVLPDMETVLRKLGFIVLTFDARDMQALAGCGFSTELEPGTLMLNRPISADLRKRLENAGVRVLLHSVPLGNLQAPHWPFGIGSMVLQIRSGVSREQEAAPAGASYMDVRAHNETGKTDL
jgi:hypothetical protein